MRHYTRLTFHRVLCKFGHLIESIQSDSPNAVDVNAIAKYCGPNLKHLKLYNETIDRNLMAPIM